MKAELPLLTADYQDSRVRIGGKTYAAGAYGVLLLNQYYKDDTAARLSVFKQHGWNVEQQLSTGYVNTRDFIDTGEELRLILQTLPKLKPFDKLDIAAECNRVHGLFSEEAAEKLQDYFHRRAAIGSKKQAELELGLFLPQYDRAFFAECERLVQTALQTIHFYHSISSDMQRAFAELKTFVSRLEEASRFDETHLIPIALDIFGAAPFPLQTKYVSYQKNAKSNKTLARRLSFDRYYSFILTDFFEGLHHGHYPRKCGICGKYFLMTSARRQQYCSGTVPIIIKGRKVSCRNYAAMINRRELAAANPIVDIYTRRCNAIRSEKSRGTITAEFMAEALKVAQEYKLKACEDLEYFQNQYETDMSRAQLYAETDRRLK